MYFTEKFSDSNKPAQEKFYKKKWFKIAGPIILILIIGGCAMAFKTGLTLNKITGGGLLQSVIHNIPGVKNTLKGEEDGRINILLLGMRGENVPGGGLLADTIMVASILPQENKVALISIPRDLYVNNPSWANKSKINAVYAAGEEKERSKGLADMKQVVGDITGLPIYYASSINFKGFSDLVNTLGGIEITLKESFSEPLQFNEPHPCDSNVFTKPTGKYETKEVVTSRKLDGRKSYKTETFSTCTNPDIECGGNFSLPAGTQTLDGETALCYVRSRTTSSDFERAKRQQIVIQKIREKGLSIGTLSDFSKISGMLNSLGDNVRTDMQIWEIQKLFDIYREMNNPQVFQRVLENSGEEFLYSPKESNGAGYILLPIGDNYDKIREMAENIFTLPAQSDIEPK